METNKRIYTAPHTEKITVSPISICAGSPPPLPTSDTPADPNEGGSDLSKRHTFNDWSGGWHGNDSTRWSD